jgi:protein-tyrosine phosphatase
MAQFVFQHLVNQIGAGDDFVIDSRATSTEETGNAPHRGTVRKMKEQGIPVLPHTASQITMTDYKNSDMIIAMDDANVRSLNRMLCGDPEEKIVKLLSFCSLDRDIADPWYTGDFDATYNDILMGCRGLISHLKAQGLFRSSLISD